MSYISLYRKYRSQSFDQVVGQTPITRTLQNAIRTGRISHAYLFCGPRGTGKTSTARLLAKALNCAQGPTPEPCNVCDACLRIRDGQAMDVVEIDAASNRGIDEIRNLRENVKFVPAEGRYKIYVIDEVHMLTTEAFNALLKTLEEPPDNVVFVLATTESHKVPATVLSRCQRFDFKRGSLRDLVQRLDFVASGEGVELDPQAANLLAKNAEGSWRDALSLLEQVMAFSGSKVTLADTAAVLGAVDSEKLCQVVDDLSAGDASAAFRLSDELLATGRDLRQLLWGLTEHYRNLLVAKLSRTPSGLADVSAEAMPGLERQAQQVSMDQAMEAIDILSEADKESRWNNQHRLILEITLLKLVRLHSGIRKAEAPARQEAATAAQAPVARPAPAVREEPAPMAAAGPPSVARMAEPIEAEEEMPPPPDEPPAGDSREPGGLDLRQVRKIWPKVVDEVVKNSRGPSGALKSVLLHSVEVASCGDHEVVLTASGAMGRSKADEAKNLIAGALSELLGSKISCRLQSAEGAPAPTLLDAPASVEPRSAPRETEEDEAPKKPSRNMAVRQEALKIFDGKIEGG